MPVCDVHITVWSYKMSCLVESLQTYCLPMPVCDVLITVWSHKVSCLVESLQTYCLPMPVWVSSMSVVTLQYVCSDMYVCSDCISTCMSVVTLPDVSIDS